MSDIMFFRGGAKRRNVDKRISGNDATLSLEDVSDDEMGENSNTGSSNMYDFSNLKGLLKGNPVSLETAVELKSLVLGTPHSVYPKEWLEQYFEFSPHIDYGLLQRHGGPCGVLASVQAHLLVYEFHKPFVNREKALAKALAHILWKIGQENEAVLAFVGDIALHQVAYHLKPDGVTERISWTTFDDHSLLLKGIENILSHCPRSFGCIPFVYSCLLTRGIDEVRQDFDSSLSSLIGDHSYCTQELVNLLTIGKAVSNVFDYEVNCDTLKLKGITKQSEIGFLSLFEHYNSCRVGLLYKNPVYPIWIILSESHFSVLFSKEPQKSCYNKKDKLDLFYYDGLAGQEKEIKLSLINDSEEELAESIDSKSTPPIELCIRTKWPHAKIDWNGTPPIL